MAVSTVVITVFVTFFMILSRGSLSATQLGSACLGLSENGLHDIYHLHHFQGHSSAV